MKKTIKNILILVITVTAVIYPQTQKAEAAWGGFDPSFGFLGAALDSVTDHYPKNVAIQPDGKILVTGYRLLSTGKHRFFLRRYLSNGQIDTTFGKNGSAVSNALIATNGNYRGVSIAIQADGKIAVAGFGNGYYAVWRFHSNGYSDSTIGYGGMRTLSNYSGNFDPTLTVQNNKLIVGVGNNQARAILVRLNTNGTVDTTFGSQGEVVTGIYSHGGLYVLVESETDKITIGGIDPMTYSGVLAERRLPNGQIDPGFVSESVSGFYHYAQGFIRLSNQKYVFAGAQPGSPYMNIAPLARLAKLDSTGVLESRVTYQEGSDDNKCPLILAEQTDGKVIAQGMGRLYRFNTDLDPNTAEINFCSSFTNFTSITRAVLQADDKMVVAGRYNSNLVLVRTLPN